MSLPSRPEGHRRRQRGAALLLILLLIVTAVSYSLLRRFDASAVQLARQETTTAALATAKQALIAHALSFGEMHRVNADPLGSTTENDAALPPGTLPCPEQSVGTGEGRESGNCGGRDVAAIGRLPWYSLGLPALRDGAGECLWYAVSGSFKANTAPHLLNRDSVGQFEIRDAAGNVIAGGSPETRPVAVVFAVGAALPGQNRARVSGADECGGNYAAANYLDSLAIGGTTYSNAGVSPLADAVSAFIVAPVGDRFNDRLVTISRDELFARGSEKRADFAASLFDPTDATGKGALPALTQKVAATLAKYGKSNAVAADHRLPWAAPLDVSDFANDRFDDSSGLYAGRPPYRVGSSRGPTGSTLVPAGCSAVDNCRLLIVDRAASEVDWWRVAGKPLNADGTSRHDSPEGWWDKWKDHLFYVVSPEFAPTRTPPIDWSATPNPCEVAGNQCVTVGPQKVAAAIVFAGQRVAATQQRNTLAERQAIANYLEAPNTTAFVAPTTAATRVLAANGSDRIVCIRAADLSIDADCGAATCAGHAATLAGKMSGSSNLCRLGGGAVDPICASTAAGLNALGCACAATAATLLVPPCLNNLNPPACAAAVADLASCS